MKKSLVGALAAAALLCAGCTSFSNPYSQRASTGLVGGTAVGAGAGALIGSLISNGDVGESALVGAAVGAVSGVAAGVAYEAIRRERILSANAATIEENNERLQELMQELDRRREADLIDHKTTVLDESLKEEHFVGATIGVYQ